MDNMNKQSVTELLQSTESNYSFGIFPYYPLSSIQSAEYALNIRHNLLFKIIKKDYQWNTLLKRYPVEQVFLWIDNHHPLTEKEKKDAENIWKKLKLQPIADESIKIPVLNISYKIFCDTIAARCLIHHPEAFVRLKSALLKACDVNASQEDDIDYSISIHNKIQKVFHTVPGIECFAGTILDMLQEDFEKTFSFFYTDRVVEKYLSMTITRLDQKTHQQYATTFLSACIHAVWPEATFQQTEYSRTVTTAARKEEQRNSFYKAFLKKDAPFFIKHFIRVLESLLDGNSLQAVDRAYLNIYMKNVYPEIAQAVLESEIIPTECIVAYLKYYGISLSEDYTKCYSWYDMAKPTEKYLLSVGDEVAHDMIYEQMTHILIHGGGRLMRLAPAVMISLASSGLIHGRKNQNPIAARFRDRLGKLFVSPHDLITSNIKTSQFSIEQFVAQHFAQFFVENLHDIFNKKDQYPTEFQRILEDVISAKVVPCFRLTFDPKIMAIDAIDIHLTWDRIAKVMQLPAPWIQMLCLQGGLFDPLNWARTQLYYGFGQKAPKNSAFDYWKLKRPHKHKEEKELLHPRSDCMLIIDEPIKQILEIEDECAILKRTANEYMKQIISKLQHQVSNTKFTYKKNILLTFPHCSYEELMEGLHACSINTRIKEQILNANQSRLHDVYAAFSKQNFSQISLVALFKYWESQPEVAKNWIERLERRLWSLLIEDVSADSSHLFAYLIEGFISADRPEVNPIANPLQKDRGSENHQHNGLIKPMGMRAEHSKIREGNLVKKPYKALTRAQQDWLDKLSDWPIEKYPRINMQLIVKLISYYHIKADVLIERLVRYSPSIPECSLSDFSAICEALTQTALFPICAELLERIAVELDLQHVSAFAPSPLIKRLTISSTASTLDLMLSIQESVFHYKTDAWPSKLKESLNHYQASYLKYALRFPFKLYNDTYFKGQNSHKNRMQRKLRGIQRRHFKSLIQVCYPAVQEMLDSYEKRYILGLLILSHASAGSIEMLLIRPEYRELLIAFNHKITHWLKIAKESSLTLSSEAQFLERYRIAMKKYYFHHYGDRSLLAHIGAEDYMRGLIAVVMHSQRPLSQKYELLRVLYHAGIATHCDFFIQGQQNKIFANSLSLKDSDLNISYEEFDSWCDVLVANSYAKCIKMAFSIFHTPRHVHFYDDFFSKRVVFLCTALTTRLSKETIEVLLNECAIRSADLRPLLLHPDIANQLDLYSLYITIKWCLKNTEPEYLAVEKDGIAKYLHTYLKRVRDDWPEDQSYTARRQMIKLFNWFFNDLKVEFIQPIPFFRWAQRKSVLPIVRWMVTHFKDVVIAQWTWFQYFRSYFFTEELPVRPRDFMQWILGKVDYMPYFSAWLREYSHDELTTPRDRETIAYNICRLTQLRHELMIPSELEGQQEFSQNDFHLLMRESSAIVYSEGAVGNIGTNVAKKRPSAKKK